MQFLENRQIDKKLWNRSVEKSLHPTIFADFDFLTIASPTWCALIEGDYEFIMPLATRSKLGVKYIYTPFFFSMLGIFSDKEITAEVTTRFFNAIPQLYRQIDLLLKSDNLIDPNVLHPVEMHSYNMKLNRPYILMEQRFSENTKRNIKTANKANLLYSQQLSVKEIITLFKEGRGQDKSVRYGKKDYQLLEQLAALALKKGLLDIIGVKDERGQLLAGALFLHDFQNIRFWFSGRDYRYPEKKAMFFLINEYLKKNEQQNLILDFNGSMNENIARFYKGFGAEPYNFSFINLRRYSYLSPFIRLYKSIIKQDKK